MNLCKVIPVLAEARVPGFVLEAASADATDVVMRARATAAAVRRLAVRDVQIARCMRRKKGGGLWQFVIHVPVCAAVHVVLRVHLVAVAVEAVVAIVLHALAAVGVDQDVRMRAMDVVVLARVLPHVAVALRVSAPAAAAVVLVLAALVAAVVAVAVAAPAHAEDVRPAVHVQIYVQADALDHVMRGAATAASRPA